MPDTFEFPDSGELWLPLDELTLGGNAPTARATGLRVFGVLQARRDVRSGDRRS